MYSLVKSAISHNERHYSLHWYGSVDQIRSDLTSGTSDEKREYMEYDIQLVLRMKSVTWVNLLPSQNSKPLPRLSMPVTENIRVRFLEKPNPHHPILRNHPHPTTLVLICPDLEIIDPDRTSLLNLHPCLPHLLLKLWILIPSWVRTES
jgi:hypothetical protein